MKKILSVALSLFMVFGVFSIFASAENVMVDTAEITIDTDIAGVSATDYESYITILTSGLEFEDNYGDPGVYIEDIYGGDFEGDFVEGETYTLNIFLSAKEGYELADYVDSSVNGQAVDSYVDYWYPESDAVYFVRIDVEITIGEDLFVDADDDADSDLIDEAEIEIGTDLAGYYVSDYDYYIDILTDNLEFEDNYGDPAVFVYDEYGNEFTGEFRSGETYTFYVFLSAKPGYELADSVDCYVNGESVDSYVDCWYPEGDLEVEFVGFEFEVTVDGEREFNFFDFIRNFFLDLYYNFLLFFLLLFI